jgi:hypothetical protein
VAFHMIFVFAIVLCKELQVCLSASVTTSPLAIVTFRAFHAPQSPIITPSDVDQSLHASNQVHLTSSLVALGLWPRIFRHCSHGFAFGFLQTGSFGLAHRSRWQLYFRYRAIRKFVEWPPAPHVHEIHQSKQHHKISHNLTHIAI